MDKEKFISDFFYTHSEILISHTFIRVRNKQDAEELVFDFFSKDLPKNLDTNPNLWDVNQLLPFAKTCLSRDVNDLQDHRKVGKKVVSKLTNSTVIHENFPFEDIEFAKVTLGLIVAKANLNPSEKALLACQLKDYNKSEIAEHMNKSKEEVYNISTTMMRKLRDVVKKKEKGSKKG